jgi:hypothetical protein
MSNAEGEPVESAEKALSPEEQAALRAKELVDIIIDAQAELEVMPREVLIKVAWEGIASYHVEKTAWGNDEFIARKGKVKEYRKSLLNPGELKRAIYLANDWLDDNFSQ